MSGKERLQARASVRSDELLKRIMIVVGLLAFLALGLAFESSQSSQRQARAPIKPNKRPSASASAFVSAQPA
jgi:hypothetical protein